VSAVFASHRGRAIYYLALFWAVLNQYQAGCITSLYTRALYFASPFNGITLQRIRKFLETNGAKISVPDKRTFETEGQAIERAIRRTVEGRDVVTRNLIRAVYRFRDAALVEE
jgi:hypothetical protein